MIKRVLRLLILAGLLLTHTVMAGEPPARVLFIGNSFTYYNNSLHRHYRQLILASGIHIEETSRARIMTISGGHLPEHEGGF